MDDDWVTVRVNLAPVNLEKMWTSAARNGESFQEVVNRALAFYEEITRARPGTRIAWHDVEGNQHRLKILRPAFSRWR